VCLLLRRRLAQPDANENHSHLEKKPKKKANENESHSPLDLFSFGFAFDYWTAVFGVFYQPTPRTIISIISDYIRIASA
jgi:hypothetical protein